MPAPEAHLVHRIGWLRAAVLGANDGILSTSSLIVGVAAAASGKGAILTAGLAGLVAGAMSMATGEYVSVSSQSDTERADLARERRELEEDPEAELQELADIYTARGLTPDLAFEVAERMTAVRQHALERFAELNGTGLASSDLDQIEAAAAAAGRVEALLLTADPWCWEQAGAGAPTVVELGRDPAFADCERLDSAATGTLLRRGQVFTFADPVGPDGDQVAAVFRY